MEREIHEIGRFGAETNELEQNLQQLQRNMFRSVRALAEAIVRQQPRIRLLGTVQSRSELAVRPNEILIVDSTASDINLSVDVSAGLWTTRVIKSSSANAVRLVPIIDRGAHVSRVPLINGSATTFAITSQVPVLVLSDGRDLWVR